LALPQTFTVGIRSLAFLWLPLSAFIAGIALIHNHRVRFPLIAFPFQTQALKKKKKKTKKKKEKRKKKKEASTLSLRGDVRIFCILFYIFPYKVYSHYARMFYIL
jgi:hypothetical protein